MPTIARQMYPHLLTHRLTFRYILPFILDYLSSNVCSRASIAAVCEHNTLTIISTFCTFCVYRLPIIYQSHLIASLLNVPLLYSCQFLNLPSCHVTPLAIFHFPQS